MGRVNLSTLREADELLAEVASWSEAEVDALPKLYRERARVFRRHAVDEG